MHRKKCGTIVFNEEDCLRLETYATCLTNAEIALHFGISEEALYEIKNRQPEVAAAYKKGASNPKLRATNKLLSYIDNPEMNQVNLTATIFYLKTKGGWVDASKFIEKEMVKVRQDLVDIKTIEDPKEMLDRIDKALLNIDFLMKKDYEKSGKI